MQHAAPSRTQAQEEQEMEEFEWPDGVKEWPPSPEDAGPARAAQAPAPFALTDAALQPPAPTPPYLGPVVSGPKRKASTLATLPEII